MWNFIAVVMSYQISLHAIFYRQKLVQLFFNAFFRTSWLFQLFVNTVELPGLWPAIGVSVKPQIISVSMIDEVDFPQSDRTFKLHVLASAVVEWRDSQEMNLSTSSWMLRITTLAFLRTWEDSYGVAERWRLASRKKTREHIIRTVTPLVTRTRKARQGMREWVRRFVYVRLTANDLRLKVNAPFRHGIEPLTPTPIAAPYHCIRACSEYPYPLATPWNPLSLSSHQYW